MWLAMGTFATVSVPERDGEHLEKYASAARTAIREIEDALSVFNPNSEISRLNESAGKSPVSVSDHTRKVLELAVKYAESSGGCFDVTVAPLLGLWGLTGGTVPEKPPDEAALRSALHRVGYKHLILTDKTSYLDIPNMRVNLGGIAKGYAVDMCYRKLVEMKAENIMVNLGGNIRCSGIAHRGKIWKIGVQNPFDQNQIIGTIGLTDGMAVATSGNYERFAVIENKSYAHIIDPRSGRPAGSMAGVTVISANAVEADAISTALFVAGIKESKEILRRMPHCHALFIPDKQPLRLWLTPGFRKHFTPDPAFADDVFDLKDDSALRSENGKINLLRLSGKSNKVVPIE